MGLQLQEKIRQSRNEKLHASHVAGTFSRSAFVRLLEAKSLLMQNYIQRLHLSESYLVGWGIGMGIYMLVVACVIAWNMLKLVLDLPKQLSRMSIYSRQERLFKLFKLANMPLQLDELSKYYQEMGAWKNTPGFQVRNFYLDNTEPRILGIFDHLQLHLLDSGNANICFFSSGCDLSHEIGISYLVNSLYHICGKDAFGNGSLASGEYDKAKEKYVVERLWMEGLPHIKISTEVDKADNVQYTLKISGIKVSAGVSRPKKALGIPVPVH